MKHVILGKKWSFTSAPFYKFTTEQVYGRNKQDRTFIATKVRPNEEGILQAGSFKVIKTREKGTILIVPDSNNSKKILLFADVQGGLRGGCGLLSTTTANVIARAHASSACASGISFAAILKPGQFVDVASSGRHGSFVFRFVNNNGEIEQKKMTKEEHQLLIDPVSEEEEGDEL